MKDNAIGQFVVVLIAWSAHLVSCSATHGNEMDRLSLLEFKKAISLDPQQALLSWNDSTHLCNWEGVACRTKDPRRVTSLDLRNRGLVGHISPSLRNLTFLKHLSLATNIFTGQIPPSLGQLHRLQTLFLSNNTLVGTIPSFENCSSLKALWLNNNNLAGEFPDLPLGLQQLQLSSNYLTGTIPSSLGNITSLVRFSCALNNIKGNIPNEFAKLSKMQILYVGSNQLSGRFPQAILNLSNLVSLALNSNNLSGVVPSNLGSPLPNLQLLAIAINFFHGHIPSSLINASNLNNIDMPYNNFSGVVPGSIGKLAKLSKLNLEMNNLQARTKNDWEFMISLANCTELQVLSLAGNQLEGPVPSSLGNLSSQLQHLYLGQNQLSGPFPSGIENLRSLIILGLDYNQFTGVVPQWLASLRTLQKLSLSTNMFRGSIPSSLSNLSQLVEMLLDTNQFSGHIPTSLGNLQTLATITISANNIHGRVPREIFGIPTIAQLEFSFNSLDGELPAEVGNAKQLMYLDIQSNKLFGNIPSSLGSCESLEVIEMGHNAFSGSIPTSLGNIRILKVLNLSHNNLTGSIPASLANLQLFEKLDLSFNQLNGEVPRKGLFRNRTAMWIDGNQELCGGPLELHLPPCSTIPLHSAKHMVSLVLKVVIPVVVLVSLAVIISVLLLLRRKQQENFISLPSYGRKLPKISYSDLVRATNGFAASNLIGRGRYGSVYQGMLFQDRHVVAVKVFNLETRGAQKTFIVECNTLRNVRHRNLVPIITACSGIDSNGNDFKALVYEFMSQGDLYNLLYSKSDSEDSSYLNYISLPQKLSIVVNVADALAYLHHNHQGTIVHCDLKPSNILLDGNMVAHVGDFGLARFKIDSSTSSIADLNSIDSLAINGTIGYVAPECAGGGQVSTAADVYSFGVVLLEIFIRKRPTDDMFKDGMNIATFTESNFPDKVLQIVDPQLLQDLHIRRETTMVIKDSGLDILVSVLDIGICCTKPLPSERINMQQVAAQLHGIRDAYLTGN